MISYYGKAQDLKFPENGAASMTYLRRDLVSAFRNFNWCQIANTLDDTKKLAPGAENWQWLNSTLVA
jgi:hypothetical protein